MTAHLQLVGFTTDLTTVGDEKGFLISFQTSLDMGQLGLEGNPASLAADGRVVPDRRADFMLTLSANISLTIPGMPLSGFNQNIFLPGKSLSSVGFSIDFSSEIGLPNTGTRFKLSLTAKVNALGQSFDVVNLAVNLRPDDLDTLTKVASAAVEGFKNRFGTLLKNSLLGQSIDQVGRFIKDHFNMVGQDLATAVSILSNSQPQDVIERLGKGILKLTGFKDVFDLVSKYGLNATTATAIVLKLFPILVLSPIAGPIGIPIAQLINRPTGPTDLVVSGPFGIIGGLVDLFSRKSVVQNTAPAWVPSAIVSDATSGEAIPVLPMATVTFDNSSALDVERAPQNATQALEAAATALEAAREALQKAQEAYDLAMAASSAASVEESTTEAIPALSADFSAEEVSAMEVTAGVSEEPQATSAEPTETAGPLQPESSQAETSQTEPIQAGPLQPGTQDPTITASIDPSMLLTTTADRTQIVWVSEEQLTQLIEQQRIALLDAALSVYPIEDVYEASKANFDDTTPEQIQNYFVAAGVEEDEIKELLEPAAEEQPA
jgi:hypothetical protein